MKERNGKKNEFSSRLWFISNHNMYALTFFERCVPFFSICVDKYTECVFFFYFKDYFFYKITVRKPKID